MSTITTPVAAAADANEQRNAARRATRQAKAQAHEHRYGLAEVHGGTKLRAGVKVHWRTATYTTWGEAVAAFAAGITVKIQCNDAPGTKYGWGNHRVRFAADGSVELLDHPGVVVDAQTEQFLTALGARISPCVAIAAHFPSRTQVDSSLASWRTLGSQVRALYAAVQWAQHPEADWSAEFMNTVLGYGITPASLAQWEDHGWDRDLAIRFQQQFAPLEIAETWRAHGDVSVRAAKLAARGERPDQESAWEQVGFTRTRSQRWRNTGFSPAEAYEWDRHNVPPTMVAPLLRHVAAAGGDIEVYKQWCAAGVKATDVISWYRATEGDLAAALQWQGRKLDSLAYERINTWNQQQPAWCFIDADQAKAYLAAGFRATDPRTIVYAITSGVTPQMYTDAVATIRRPGGSPLSRWLEHNRPADKRVYYWDFSNDKARQWSANALERGVSDAIGHVVTYLDAVAGIPGRQR